MSFLRINGWEIPGVGPLRRTPIEIGGRGRAFNGQPYLHRRAIKDRFTGETTRQVPVNASAVYGAMMGLGQVFPYDSDYYSHGGMGIVSGTGGTLVPATAVDGKDIVDENEEQDVKYGSGGLIVEPGTTNFLSSDSRNAENAPTGYSAVGSASLAADTALKYQGTKSLKMTATGNGDGVDTSTSGVMLMGGFSYVGSVYIYRAATSSVTVSLYDNTGLINSTTVNTAFDKWKRVDVAGTSGGGATTGYIRVVSNYGSGSIFLDGFQIEDQPIYGAYSTSWVDGTRTNSDTLEYDTSLITGGYDISVGGWFKAPSSNPSIFPRMAAFDATINSSQFLLFRQSGQNNIGASWYDHNGVTSDSMTYSGSPWDGGWHHVVFTFNVLTATASIYYDGTLGTSKVTTSIPQWPQFTGTVYVGHLASSTTWIGGIDDFFVLPYAMSADQIAGMYAMGKAMSPLPRIYVDGDFLSAPELTQLALGRIEGQPYRNASVDGTWYSNMRESNFDLDLF